MSTLIYLAGIVLAIVAVLDIVKKPIKTSGKIIASVILLLTSWVGLIIYYLYAKDHLTDWFK
ncbi:MAG: hypothetical protein II142_01220 [Bacteroidales bacterium]|nr:hypothetical protein [Bacteroidales bacterium]MEE3407271.1 hypothetical protein [Candidatus Cryptobacteroides sp.]SKC50499.1 Phospholipase_D-nuclease N-terminal [Bacteroidales bacterium WCE2008]MBQ2109772.1 hypothetical protein [Bacteroidales bacterium]MBQ2525432.1 hypothetical protein [Bacteroidales bacterium]